VTWQNALVALLIGIGVGWGAEPGMGALACIGAFAVIGIWRVVKFLGALLELQQAQVFDQDGNVREGSHS